VLYFYRFSEGLEGGTLEFMSKQAAGSMHYLIEDPFDVDDFHSVISDIPSCKVPVKEG
jgi:hypothetical protein